MAATLSVQTSIIILGVIAGLYSLISVLLLVGICCLCHRRRKIRSVSPKKGYISPQSSDGECSTPGSPHRNSESGTCSTAPENKLPKRYRAKSKRKTEQTMAFPEYEGVRESPMLARQREAWSTEKLNEDLVISNPNTPDSGLASSLGDSKHGETHSGRNSTESRSSSAKSSHSGSNEDVFDGTSSPQSLPRNNSSFEEVKRDIRRRAPRPIRTESTTPLVDEDSNALRTPGSDMEFDLKAVLPPIREKTRLPRSPDSIDGTFFANKSALTYSDGETTTYTELSSVPTRSLDLSGLPAAAGSNRELLPPIRGAPGSHGGLVGRTGRLPPLHPPGHSQENLHELDEVSTAL